MFAPEPGRGALAHKRDDRKIILASPPKAPERIALLEERLQRGDQDSLAQLFALHRERLLKIVFFRLDQQLRGRLEPEDVLQEAYLAAMKRIDRFADFSGSAFVWLRLLVQQTIVDLHRFHLGARKRDAGREVAHCSPSTSRTMTLHLFGQTGSPSRAVMQREMMDRVEQAIAAMDATDREVLAMRHFEELTNKETAETFGISEKAASIRYFRALGRLKEILGKYSVFLSGVAS